MIALYGLAARLACAAQTLAAAVRNSWSGRVPDCLAMAEFGMENPREVDLTAVMDATAEPTPEAEAAWREVVRRQCQIELAVEDFAAEIAACADAELTQLIEGETWN